METILYMLGFWFLLGVIALGLISIRKDKNTVIEDLQYGLLKQSATYGLFTIIIVYLVLPFSILYSIAYFLKRK
jgi:energy-converting hydrogenase Eha subunit H